MLDQGVANQSNQGVAAAPITHIPSSKVRDFTQMNPPEFSYFKVDVDP